MIDYGLHKLPHMVYLVRIGYISPALSVTRICVVYIYNGCTQLDACSYKARTSLLAFFLVVHYPLQTSLATQYVSPNATQKSEARTSRVFYTRWISIIDAQAYGSSSFAEYATRRYRGCWAVRQS